MLQLDPVRNVAREAKGYHALTPEPWLRIADRAARHAGHFIEMRYAANALDDVCRPLLRCIGADGRFHDMIMPAPSEGRAIWRGHIPGATTDVWISPVNREGAFSFVLESVRALSVGELLSWALQAPKRMFFALSARMVRLPDEAELNFRWVFGRAETQDWGAWKAARTTALEQTSGPTVLVLLDTGDAPLESVATTAQSLRAQTCIEWRIEISSDREDIAGWIRAQGDARLGLRSAAARDETKAAWFCRLAPGDRLEPNALACFAAHASRNPDHAAIYVDEIAVGNDNVATPLFKPDWSPLRQAFAPYVGRAAIVRSDRAEKLIQPAERDEGRHREEASVSRRRGDPENISGLLRRSALRDNDLDSGRRRLAREADAAIGKILADLPIGAVGHVRRALFSSVSSPPINARGLNIPDVSPDVRVGIVIPTRDRIDLLEPCLQSILTMTAHQNFEIVVVDNESVEPRTREVLLRLAASDQRLRVIPSPGPFNFSALSNLGAEQVSGDVLLFLNNDTVIIDTDWLDNLLSFARQADIGAVGAKLLYPDRTVQHAGVVLGMGGVAGHFNEGLPESAPGWLGGSLAPHEVSAVTGACLMVERKKFDAVGGFDAENLPVDLNDIDLCLKLAAQGWRTICDCRTRLIHHQSASRGGGLKLQKVYGKERAHFTEKWRHVIRDDPYFNPSLSLYDYEARLA